MEIVQRDDRQYLWPVLVVGLYVLWLSGLLWWLLAALATAAAVWRTVRMIEASNTARQAIIHRAELQHQQVLAGDERGVYGAGYPDWRRYRET